jgi:hypothetical protein
MTERHEIEPCTPAEFRDLLATVGWRPSDVGWVLRIDARVPARWASGTREVPRYVGHWMRILAAFHAAHPYPEGWRLAERTPEMVDERVN